MDTIQIEENKDLSKLNTFAVAAHARYYCEINTEAELLTLITNPIFQTNDKLILGGGSNMLLTRDYAGLVIKVNMAEVEVVSEDAEAAIYKVGAGKNWHEFVMEVTAKGLGGIENLAFIPGNVGAAPVQNIGAYGAEIKDVIVEVRGVDFATGVVRTLSKDECQFGYRDSIFKRELRGKFAVTYVTLRLSKQPQLNTSYDQVEARIVETGKPREQWTVQDVAAAVIEIRKTKLPDPAEIGTAGSFFKNPVVSMAKFEELKQSYPDIVSFPASETEVKVPAGWLIDRAGWKGWTSPDGKYGVHKQHALVLVNYGGGKGADIAQLAKDIQASIREKYGVELEPEVNII